MTASKAGYMSEATYMATTEAAYVAAPKPTAAPRVRGIYTETAGQNCTCGEDACELA
jgi:hypothetical protein